MNKVATLAVLVGALAAVPVMGAAAAVNAQTTAAKRPAKAATASHATIGVVKSIDATSLVIARAGKKKSEMTFALNDSTHRDGTVGVGSRVSVRYHEEGKTHVASALAVRPAKQASARKS